MNATNPIAICNDLFVICNQTFSNHTACAAAEKAMGTAPAIIQKSVCWTGELGYAIGDNWLSILNKIDYYGGCFEYLGLGKGIGVIGQAAWLLLTAALAKAVVDRMLHSRNKVVTEQELNLEQLLNEAR